MAGDPINWIDPWGLTGVERDSAERVVKGLNEDERETLRDVVNRDPEEFRKIIRQAKRLYPHLSESDALRLMVQSWTRTLTDTYRTRAPWYRTLGALYDITGMALTPLTGGVRVPGGFLRSGTRMATAAERAAANEGREIVGTKHSRLLPTQETVHPDIVAKYAQRLKAGERLPDIEAVRTPDGRRFITEGHHRYVASERTGSGIGVQTTDAPGPVGMNDWSQVRYERFAPEE